MTCGSFTQLQNHIESKKFYHSRSTMPVSHSMTSTAASKFIWQPTPQRGNNNCRVFRSIHSFTLSHIFLSSYLLERLFHYFSFLIRCSFHSRSLTYWPFPPKEERRTYLEKLSPTPPVFKHFDLISGEVSNGFVGILLGSCRQMPFAALFLCFLRLNDLDILSTPFLFPSLIIRLISLICHICHWFVTGCTRRMAWKL